MHLNTEEKNKATRKKMFTRVEVGEPRYKNVKKKRKLLRKKLINLCLGKGN